MITNIVIFVLGLLIYAGYGLPGLAYLVASTLVSYLVALATPKHRWAMWLSVAANAALLLLVKLEPCTGLGILAPMGISYFALRLISYNIDVYKGKLQPEKDLLRSVILSFALSVFIRKRVAGYRDNRTDVK